MKKIMTIAEGLIEVIGIMVTLFYLLLYAGFKADAYIFNNSKASFTIALICVVIMLCYVILRAAAYNKVNDSKVDLLKGKKRKNIQKLNIVLTLIVFGQYIFIAQFILIYRENNSIFFIVYIAILLSFIVALYVMKFSDYFYIKNERKSLIDSIEKNGKTDTSIFLLYKNCEANLSLFSRDINLYSSYNKKKNPMPYVLLDEKEVHQFLGTDRSWLYYNTKLIVNLITPALGFDQKYQDKLLAAMELFKQFPHIKQITLVTGEIDYSSEWGGFYRHCAQYGGIKSIPTIIDSSQCLFEYLSDINQTPMNLSAVLLGNTNLMTVYEGLYKMPDFIYKILKSLISDYNKVQMFFGLFDIIDISLRLKCYAQVMLNRQGNISLKELEDYIFSNYNSIAKCIFSEGKIHDNNLAEDYYPKEVLENEVKYLMKYLNCEIHYEDGFTLLGLVMLATYIRNKTKGHGRIKEEHLEQLLPALFKITLGILGLLQLDKLQVKFEDQECIAHMYRPLKLKPFIIMEHGRIFFFQKLINKKVLYIDYENGDYFRPSMNEIEQPLDQLEQQQDDQVS